MGQGQDNLDAAVAGLGSLFSQIASAIREKDGSSGGMSPGSFPVRILAIPTEGTDYTSEVKITDLTKTNFELTVSELVGENWNEYNCLTGDFVQERSSLPGILAEESLYVKHNSEIGKLLVAIQDNICLTNLNGLGYTVDQKDYRICLYPMADFTALSISGYIVGDAETNKWTIPDTDAANAYIAQISAPDMTVTQDLDEDANLNYALDNIAGIVDTENSDRTFAKALDIELDNEHYLTWENLLENKETPEIEYNIYVSKNDKKNFELFDTQTYIFHEEDLIEPEEGEEKEPIVFKTTLPITDLVISDYSNLYFRAVASSYRYHNKDSKVIDLSKNTDYRLTDLITAEYNAGTDMLDFIVPEGMFGTLLGGETKIDISEPLYTIDAAHNSYLVENLPENVKYLGIISKQNNKLYEYNYWGTPYTEFTYSTPYSYSYSGTISVVDNADGSKTLTSTGYSSYGYQTKIYRIAFENSRQTNIKITSTIYLRQYSGYNGCVGFSNIDQALSRGTNSNPGSWNDSTAVTKDYRNAPASEDTAFDLIYENVAAGEHFIDLKVQKGWYGYARINFKVEEVKGDISSYGNE